MNLKEMSKRETIKKVITCTLSNYWSARRNTETIVKWGKGNGQSWRKHNLLSSFFTTELNSNARKYLRDSFRFTPVYHRFIPQAVLGTVITTKLGIRLSSAHCFSVFPEFPKSENLLVIPGNQRVRIFDFEKHHIHVIQKYGFGKTTFNTEIELRTNRSWPFLPIDNYSYDEGWFQEPLLAGYSLPRCPPWFDKKKIKRNAIRLIDNWLQSNKEKRLLKDYLYMLHRRISSASQALNSMYNSIATDHLATVVSNLLEIADSGRFIRISLTHGDLQPGNIFVNRCCDKIWIIDWEHCSKRFFLYDHLVFGLNSRISYGFPKRLIAFIEGSYSNIAIENITNNCNDRKRIAAIFLLEDLLFYLNESLLAKYNCIPLGLHQKLEMMYHIKQNVPGLFS